MGGETSSPGEPTTNIDQTDDEAVEVSERSFEANALNPTAYGDFAGSTALADQQKGSITGSNLMDALVPGVGTLSVISSLNASYMQQSMQRGGSPVYGSRGTVEGVVNTTQAFGTEFRTYSGNPDLDPIGGGNRGGDNESTPTIVSSQVNAPVKAPAPPTRTASYNPDEVVDAYGMQSKKGRKSGRKGTIMTSAQGDTSQLKTILKPGLKGTLG